MFLVIGGNLFFFFKIPGFEEPGFLSAASVGFEPSAPSFPAIDDLEEVVSGLWRAGLVPGTPHLSTGAGYFRKEASICTF